MSYSELLKGLSRVWDIPIDRLVGLEVGLRTAEVVVATPTETAFTRMWINANITRALAKEFKRGLND